MKRSVIIFILLIVLAILAVGRVGAPRVPGVTTKSEQRAIQGMSIASDIST